MVSDTVFPSRLSPPCMRSHL